MKTPGQHISLWQRVNRFGVKCQKKEIGDPLPTIRNSTVFDIQNVEDYCMQFREKQFNFRHLPNVLPPFEECFMQYTSKSPSHIGKLFQFGVLSSLMDLSDDKYHEWRSPGAFYVSVLCILFWKPELGATPVLCGPRSVIDISENGQYLNCGVIDAENLTEVDLKTIKAVILPALLATSFLHCKNVSRVAHEIDEPPKAIRHNKDAAPKYRYHVLQIDPMKEVLRTEGQSETVGLKKALHICRGHFRTYGEESKGLFGRGQHGTFFVPSHVRGNAKRGVVAKDYAITGLPVSQPPKEE